MHRFLIPSLLLLLLSASIALAQHDPQRNATQAIAVGDFKKAEKELKKVNEADPETMYVRMMLALKQGSLGWISSGTRADLFLHRTKQHRRRVSDLR